MGSIYEGPDRHEILASVGTYNKHHHKVEQIRIAQVSKEDVAAVGKIMSQTKSSVVRQINRVIDDLIKIRKDSQGRDPRGQETTLSSEHRKEIIDSVKKLLSYNEEEEKKKMTDIKAAERTDVAGSGHHTARWVRENQIASLHARVAANKKSQHPQKELLEDTQHKRLVTDDSQALAHLKAQGLASEVRRLNVEDDQE